MRNWYAELSKVDVNEHIETKNGLKYLSWMWAWNELKQRFPLSYATVHETPEGTLIWRDPVGAHVKTSITIVWEDGEDNFREHTVTEYLPVMDFKNKSVPYDACDSMIVNKTIQRSLTKCIARLGLGGYIYAGEDLPMEPDAEAAEKAAQLAEVINQVENVIKEKVKGMNKDDKIKFANEKIVPIIGQTNFKACKDVDKMKNLLTVLNAA